MNLDSRQQKPYSTEEGLHEKRPIITKRCFYGSNLQKLQQNCRGNNSGLSPNTLRSDTNGFKVPNQEAPISMAVENFREVRSFLVRRAALMRLLERHPHITSLRLPKLQRYLKNKMIKEWVNFKMYEANYKSCRSITYVNGDTRIRIATNRQSVVTNSPLRTDADIGPCVPALRRYNCSNPRESTSESGNPRDASTPTSAGSSFRTYKETKASPSPPNSPNSTLYSPKSHDPTLERRTHEFPKEAYAEDVVDKPTSFGLELIRLNYENPTQSQVFVENDLINGNEDQDRVKIGACEDQCAIPKARTAFGRSRSNTIGKLNYCYVSLKRIDKSRRKSRRIKLQRNSQIKPCSSILNPLLNDAGVDDGHNAIGIEESFPTDYKRLNTNQGYQEHGNPLKNPIKPCYVKLKRLDSGQAVVSGTKAPFPFEKSLAEQLLRTAVKECSVKLNRITWKYPNKSRTTTCVPLQRVHVTSEKCYQGQKCPEFGGEQDGTFWAPDLKRCSVLMERLEQAYSRILVLKGGMES